MALCKDEFGRDICNFVFNDDGTVSGIVAITTTGGTVDDSTSSDFIEGDLAVLPPAAGTARPISPECCSALGFTFSEGDQQCYWSESCDIIDEFKIVVNPKGNDGAIFDVDENESCILEVEFDYLIEYDCNDLLSCKYDNQEDNSTDVGDILVQIEEKQNAINELTAITTDLQTQKDALLENQTALQTQLETDISIKQASFDDLETQLNDVQIQIANIIAAGDSPAPFLLTLENSLTSQLDMCFVELQDLTTQLENITNDSTLFDLQQQCNALTDDLNACLTVLADLQQQLDDLTTSQTTGSVETIIGMLEGLDICVTIDKVVPRDPDPLVGYEDPFTLETIYEESLFKIDDIVEYLRNNTETGLLFNGDNCQTAINCILAELSGNCDVVSATSFNSNWLHRKIVISDEETLSAITNEKIKLTFRVKDCKCDFSILMDRIEMNKRCTTIDREDTFVSRCPSFDLTRVCDNKKSWLALDDRTQREFELSKRLTDYTTNHHKLVINSKEVDLSISPATAVENDVWCYMIDNPCVLTACTNDTLCTGTTCTATTLSSTTIMTDACFPVSMVKPTPNAAVTTTLPNHGLSIGDIFTISGSTSQFNTELTGFGVVSGVTDINTFVWNHDLTFPATLSGTGILKKYELNNFNTGVTTVKTFLDANAQAELAGINNAVILVEPTFVPTGFTFNDWKPYRLDSSANPYQLGYSQITGTTGSNFLYPTSGSTGSVTTGITSISMFTIAQSSTTITVEVPVECFDCGGNPLSGVTCTNIEDLMTTPVSAITTVKEFENVLCTELIDAKSRKTLGGYPLLRELYYRYLNGEEVCGVKSSEFNYFSMADFADLIGNYWVDLVEQVIPATTIWGATYTHKNTVFDKEKFKYRKYTTFICDEPTNFPLDLINSEDVNVVYQDLSKPENITPECLGGSGNTETCDGVYLLQIDDGSEFIGSVSIIANPDDGGGTGSGSGTGEIGGGNTDTGDIIIVNESPDISPRVS